jgi:hypothetical protein
MATGKLRPALPDGAPPAMSTCTVGESRDAGTRAAGADAAPRRRR